MLTQKERLSALLGNIKNWSWDIHPTFKIEQEDAEALLEYFKTNDKSASGALSQYCLEERITDNE